PTAATLAGGLRASGVPDPAFSTKGAAPLTPMMSPLLLIARYCVPTVGASVSLYCVVAACAGPAPTVAARAAPATTRARTRDLRPRGDDARRRGNDTVHSNLSDAITTKLLRRLVDRWIGVPRHFPGRLSQRPGPARARAPPSPGPAPAGPGTAPAPRPPRAAP